MTRGYTPKPNSSNTATPGPKLKRILVIDDERKYYEEISPALSGRFFLTYAKSSTEGLARLEAEPIDVVILDYRLAEGKTGLDVLEEIHRRWSRVIVVFVSKFFQLEEHVIERAGKLGAVCVSKHDNVQTLVQIVLGKLKERRLERERTIADLAGEAWAVSPVFDSPVMQAVRSRLDEVKDFSDTILVTGRKGTGKEVLARWIHDTSAFAEGPFTVVSLPTIPDELFSSILFGYARGSHATAYEDRKGIFELAAGGTVVLDEIGDLSLENQAKLLRVIQNKEIAPLGGAPTWIAVRVIALTNHDLEAEVASGLFRADLYDRLKGTHVRMPRLSERREDIPAIARQMIERFGDEFGKEIMGMDPALESFLLSCPWDDDIRGLEHFMRALARRADAKTLRLENVDEETRLRASTPGAAARSEAQYRCEISTLGFEGATAEFQKAHVNHLLRRTGGNITAAAELAGMARPAFHRLLNRLGIDADSYRR